MTREQKARCITIVVLGAAVVWIIGRQVGWRLLPAAAFVTSTTSAQSDDPRGTIYRMLDAVRSGDAAAYLDCFSGQMAGELQQSRSEMGGAGFTRYLIQTSREVKGITVSEPVTVTDRQVSIQIEYVYEDRNEAQQVYLERTAQGWGISRVDSTERVRTLVPYGTRVE